ncbi:protein of unknown function DUF1018 [Candidatus Magnetoovum chiemensis]|nr:protein of unknown function DUF1018 [Candidatus Magnetoovum chiemensis]
MKQQSSKNQRQLIKIGQKHLGWSDDFYRDVLTMRYGADSSTKLSYADAQDLLAHFEAYGFEVLRKSKRFASSRKGLIEELEHISYKRWGENYVKALNEFINHRRKVKTSYKLLTVKALKAFKMRINEMNMEDRDAKAGIAE